MNVQSNAQNEVSPKTRKIEFVTVCSVFLWNSCLLLFLPTII